MLYYFNLLLYIPYIMQVPILNYMISPFCIKLREHKIANPDDHGLIFRIFKPHDLLEVSFFAWEIDDFCTVFLSYPTNYQNKYILNILKNVYFYFTLLHNSWLIWELHLETKFSFYSSRIKIPWCTELSMEIKARFYYFYYAEINFSRLIRNLQ